MIAGICGRGGGWDIIGTPAIGAAKDCKGILPNAGLEAGTIRLEMIGDWLSSMSSAWNMRGKPSSGTIPSANLEPVLSLEQ